MDKKRVLVDTSAWIEALRPSGSKGIKEKVDVLLGEDCVATSGIIKLELLSGTRTEKEYHELSEDLQSLHYIPTDEEVWRCSCRLSRDIKKEGLSIPATDLLIASVAITAGCAIMHLDKHFTLLAKHSPLQIMA
ncbi:MAG: PIN domain nuclease [Candidatus Omnitrophica bacterium]|nr:PIN domain nuclease [Candidatus Omnitrophota bacterium]